ncbi:hypothetical protein [Alteraurantiacibacter aquimixticola]|uniref:Uncharacterized protein n=1 Tax=Alteraurantiacibacter aquimixticola TaxID=2489173 RepID=A0A4V4U8C5_9SPHN|nr:hypothetical protein [Alteraurantiacibacter aquimixticola]TIX49317.1 hypothetical protein E5222_16210 [Alteraurantiacibacter aquimixticola]
MALAVPVAAQQAAVVPAAPTYVDLVELSLSSGVVLRAEIDDQITVPPERAPGVRPGHVRLYLEAETQALLAGSGPIGESLAFLSDQPREADGDVPKLKKRVYLLYGRRVEGRPGEIQLIAPNAMQPYSPELEQRARAVLRQLVEAPPPPIITGVREVMSVPGNLVGESETQIFLDTRDGAPVSLTVLRRPGMAPQWGVSWSDIVDQSARPPQPQTPQWYALACHLPQELPEESFLQNDPASRARARDDYSIVLAEIGPCARSM